MLKKKKLVSFSLGILVVLSIAEYNTTNAYGSSLDLIENSKPSSKNNDFVFAGEEFPYTNTVHYNRYMMYQKQILNQNIETAQMIKRSVEVFKVIEPILKKHHIPEDFKYLAVLESGLNKNITSPAHAKGIWQLMGSTGRAMGLKINNEVDERLDLVKSTEAVCKLLKGHKRFFGTWTEALVAFNMGNTALFKFQKAQNNYKDIYSLKMYVESTHVIYKILAYKKLFSHLEVYGYHVPKSKERYRKPAKKGREFRPIALLFQKL